MAEPIAIVGIGCRFAGAENAAAFWQLVKDGVDAITEIPAGRFDADALYDPNPGARGKIVTRQGGFLREVDGFDAAFFGISPREAVCVDPQQRLLLEVAWEAFEDAGITQEHLAGSPTGVFIGMWTSEYESRMFATSPDIDLYVTTGGGRYAASGRLSYAFDLRGPSLTLDTACSSSLVAVHLACQSLRSGESEMALAGGVNLILEPHITIGYSRSAMLSADGRCRFGDAQASGYVRSEGVGLVVLKPLSRALADGDPIHAVIRGSAVNNDGQGSGLLVAPSPAVQAVMLRQAYRVAGVDPGRVGYVEAHGTGTRVGDPVELAALGEVLAQGRAPGQPCRVGSVKTNIGHAEAASGIAGLIKAAFCLEHRLIPPSLHFVEPNPRISWDQLPLAVARTPEPWPDEFSPAFAGVNSFGVTGTNAHVVLEAAPRFSATAPDIGARGGARCLPLSAKTPAALRALAKRWVARLDQDPSAAETEDLCYTASTRRTDHAQRLTVTGATPGDLREHLRAYLSGEARAHLISGPPAGTRPRVVFVFPGQGSQWLGMGRLLLATEPVFAETLERCERALAPHVSWSLRAELAADDVHSQLERIDVVQPTLFAIQVALAALWQAWGVAPEAVVGHSMGEIAAAHVAGALSLDDAARVVATRSRLLRAVAGRGGMAMVELSFDEARRAVAGHEDRLSVAVTNGPRSTVLSGDMAALDDVLARLERQGVYCRRVRVDVASHSPHVDGLLPDLVRGLRGLAPRAAGTRLYSTVTGAVEDGATLGPEYWARNLREPVLFAHALQRLVADGFGAFIEVSAHPVLLPPVEDALRQAGLEAALALPSARREEDERAVMLASLGALWTRGYPVAWAHAFDGPRRVVSLPTYPWQHERFWYERSRPRAAASTGHALLTTHVRAAVLSPGSELWEGRVASADFPCVPAGGSASLSPAGCLDVLLGVARSIAAGGFTLEDVELPATLSVDDGATIQVIVQPDPNGRRRLTMVGQASDATEWLTLACAGFIGESPDGAGRTTQHDLDSVRTRTDEADGRAIAGSAAHRRRSALSTLRLGERDGLVRLHDTRTTEPCALHPEVLEVGLGLLSTVAGDGWRVEALRHVHAHASLELAVWVHAVQRDDETGDTRIGDVWFLGETGAVVLELSGVRLALAPAGPVEELLARVEWQAAAQPAASVPRVPGRWLLVANANASAAALGAALGGAGDHCVIVSPADAMAGKVEATLDSAGLPFVGCVHLASVDVVPGLSPTAPDVADLTWASALSMVQALARRIVHPPRLWLITRGAQRVVASDRSVSLGAAALSGLGAVVAYEHPALRTTRVDLGFIPEEGDVAALAEVLGAGDAEDAVALRGVTRYVPRLVRGAPAEQAPTVDPDGAYLVTGGLGGLGLATVRWLAARGARHVTVMGRRAPSPEVVPVLEELRAAGVEVSVARGDVTQREDVRRVAAETSRHRPLRGVIHAAGSLDDGLLLNLDRQRFAAVMAPKVDGALHLDDATRAAPLDFFVTFSSVIGVLGSPGQANYAAANACLDAVVARRQMEGRPGLSIAWGPWTRVGLAAARGDRGQRLQARGLSGLTPEEGTAALGRVLAASGTVVVARFNPARWSHAYPAAARSLLGELRDTPSPTTTSTGLLDRLHTATPLERRRLLEAELREQIGLVLRVAPAQVEREAPLKALGLNSLMSLELRNRLEAALGLTLPATLVWNYPTVEAIATHLAERLGLTTEAASRAGDVEDPELERLLTEIQELPAAEVRRLLADGGADSR